MIKGLLEGLYEMHSKNIMHRDLKPENIMFKNEDSLDLVIADLGLGTKTTVDKFLYVRCGTPGFVAPEVINITDFDLKYDAVCDIYSLGIIYHILYTFIFIKYKNFALFIKDLLVNHLFLEKHMRRYCNKIGTQISHLKAKNT